MDSSTATVDPSTRRERPPYGAWAPTAPDGVVFASSLAPGTGPLEIDVGFGRGLSLLARAEAAPNVRLVGIETKAKWVCKVRERLRRSGLTQVQVYAGDARDILRRLEPAACVDRVFVHFPDPWWKKRHRKRKVVDPAFVHEVARLLRDGGELFVQTDVLERAVEYRAVCDAHRDMDLTGRDGWVDGNPYGSVSNRERRAALDGLPVYRMLVRRRPRNPSVGGSPR